MGRSLAAAVVGLCLLGVLVGTATATDNAPPLPDAGLDQTVPADATVHLDANGSRDPDGSLAGVRWTVETPGGRTLTPDCPTCRQTQFEPTATGRYNVTLTVTDDDGATRSDRLFVDVRADSGPSVTLSGPSSVVWNRSATLTADVDAGDAALSSTAWVVDGRVVQRDSLSEDGATATLSRAYTASESVSVRAVVYDSVGRRATASHSLTVLTRSSGGGNGGGGNSSSDDDCPFWTNSCLSDAVLTNSETGEQTVINANGEQGIQVMTDAYGLVDASEYVDVDKYKVSTGRNGPTRFDADMIEAVDNEATLDKTAQKNDKQTESRGNENDDRGDSVDDQNYDSNARSVDNGAQDGYNLRGGGNAGSPSTESSNDSSNSWTGSGGTSFGGFSGGSYF